MRHLIIGILFFFLAQILTWFHIQGQFIWVYFKENPLVISLMGIPISYLYILATKFTVGGMGGLLWPARFIGFGVGIIVYAFLVGIFFKEGISLKTLTSLGLSIAIILIQILWK
tara:strand:- start:169 stop:510 length:342 start_codon:yes stop_codon:yes gene_type:complete